MEITKGTLVTYRVSYGKFGIVSDVINGVLRVDTIWPIPGTDYGVNPDDVLPLAQIREGEKGEVLQKYLPEILLSFAREIRELKKRALQNSAE